VVTRAQRELAGKRVLVVGLARSGKAAIDLLLRSGSRVVAADRRGQVELCLSCEGWRERGVELVLGEHPPGLMNGIDLVVASPGVPLTAPLLSEARERGVPVIGELELAYSRSDAEWVAVTGTNGKTTTTALIGELVRSSGRHVAVGGNIGAAISGEIAGLPSDGLVVAEVSSFQLDTIDTFRPHVGVVLNITEDHLDRYDSYQDYIAAKFRMFENQTSGDYAVLNVDDELLEAAADEIPGLVVPVSRFREVDGGVFVRDGQIVSQIGGGEIEIMPVSELGLPGPHNLWNSLAALAAALLVDIDFVDASDVLRTFRSLEHRLEDVAEIDGVRYVNDSKATNVDSVKYALMSYGVPIIWIAGGKDKGSSFELLKEPAARSVREAIFIGEAAAKMTAALEGTVPVTLAESLREAVELAGTMAERGDVVLLSPACASFDMFEDFEDRGRRFKDEVARLKNAAATPGRKGNKT
jgi:UDP-N-acetylmuramoylalanine--D-glutamate ligase